MYCIGSIVFSACEQLFNLKTKLFWKKSNIAYRTIFSMWTF